MNKVVYIIPGFSESNKQKPYKQIAKFFTSKKIKPIPVDISWNYNTMSDYVEQLMEKYNKHKGKEVYLIGFSFGAMIAFIASKKIKPKLLILCSLSPFFNEDLKYLTKSFKKIVGKKRLKDLRNHSFNRISKDFKSKTIIIYGDKEIKDIKRRVKSANKKLKNSRLIVIKDAEHKISQKEYIDALKKLISGL